MASFPTVLGTATSTRSTGTDHSVTMPGGIVAGEILLVFASFEGTTGITVPGDWTVQSNTLNAPGIRLLVVSKIAAGSDTLTLTSAASTSSAHAAYRAFSNDNTLRITTATGTSTTPNPPSLNNGASQKFLWFAAFAGDSSSATVTSYPANYTTNQLTAHRGRALLAVATRNNEIGTEDPGVFTIPASDRWACATVSIDEQALVNGNFPIVTSVSDIFAPAIDFAGNGTFPLLVSNSSFFTPSTKAATKANWVNEPKPSTTWINEQR